jgi:NDP-sugar pyrophosphorylase family protein
MFFGLRNSPATFQAMMDNYFSDMIDEGWIAIYMDDILIHARTKEDLEKRTKRVLERLKKHNLYLKPEKCKFE